ncbi:hypothetical protein QZH41_004403 [Actinostola sp. cb2023]|nr:hypothetical protein QZH41_004403 [Actinostola sp. cb2023]
MPPISAEVFQEKVLAQRAEAEAKEQSKTVSLHCKICNKNFSSENAFKNHMQSKKHHDVVAKTKEEDSSEKNTSESGKKSVSVEVNDDAVDDDEEAEECEDEALEITECLFCPHESTSYEDNMKHMSRSHSFYIPDLGYVVDLKGLIAYLGEKVGIGKMCLFCNEKSKNFLSVEAVQNHMLTKSHTKLDYDGDAALEYAEFYDFSSSYPDNADDDNNIGTGTLTVDETTNELCLPSGAKAGHRDLRHYYRQHLRPERESRQQMKVKKSIMADYKALGWHGMIGETTRQKIRDINTAQRKMAKHQTRLAVKANKLQPHFRLQILF